MNLNGFTTMLAQAAPAAPAPGGAAGQQQTPPGWMYIILYGLMAVMLYVVLIRPQSKKAKEQAALLKMMKPGDKVATASGIMGIVVSVKEKSVSIRSADSKLEILKSAITEILERGGETGGNQN